MCIDSALLGCTTVRSIPGTLVPQIVKASPSIILYGSELPAMKNAIEQIEALRYKFQKSGVLINGSTNIFVTIRQAVLEQSLLAQFFFHFHDFFFFFIEEKLCRFLSPIFSKFLLISSILSNLLIAVNFFLQFSSLFFRRGGSGILASILVLLLLQG